MAVVSHETVSPYSPTRMAERGDADSADLGTFQLVRQWGKWMEVAGRADSTRRQYRRYLISFVADVLIPLDALTEDDVVSFLGDPDLSPQMRAQFLRALRSFFAWAEDRDRIVPNPVKRMRVPKKRRRGKPPNRSDGELERIFTAAERLDPRARPTLELMYATGGRLGSIAGILPEDVHLVERELHFRVAKNDDPYDVPLGRRALEAAVELLELRDWKPKQATHRLPTLVGAGAGTIYQWTKLAGEIAGVKAWPHLFRHCFLHRVANDPRIPPLVAADLANHKDTRLLLVYAAGDDELKRLAVADV
jgi:integrase